MKVFAMYCDEAQAESQAFTTKICRLLSDATKELGHTCLDLTLITQELTPNGVTSLFSYGEVTKTIELEFCDEALQDFKSYIVEELLEFIGMDYASLSYNTPFDTYCREEEVLVD